ncbi:MAG: hypothetical protein EAZ42_13245 [Verrucomicrobia bacterium]|nr:MAG: hypothetical protein EAZ42_13245 [Verrucomicrobiota bacterium]
MLKGNSDHLCLAEVRSSDAVNAAYAIVSDMETPEWTGDDYIGFGESIARLRDEFQTEKSHNQREANNPKDSTQNSRRVMLNAGNSESDDDQCSQPVSQCAIECQR